MAAVHDDPPPAKPAREDHELLDEVETDPKLVRRNRAAVTGAAVALVAVVLGIAGTSIGLWRARQAEQRAADLEQVVEFQADRLSRALEAEEEHLRQLAEVLEQQGRSEEAEAYRRELAELRPRAPGSESVADPATTGRPAAPRASGPEAEGPSDAPPGNDEPRSGQPSPAIDACRGKEDGAACSFSSPEGTLNGTCRNLLRLRACVPQVSRQ